MKHVTILTPLFILACSINYSFANTSRRSDLVDTSTTGTYYISPKYAPEFPGGKQAFNEFLNKNIHLPAADNNTITVKAGIEFIVEIDGSVSHISTFGEAGAAFNAEFVRVMKLSPRWQAGAYQYKNNKTVTRSMCMLPVDIVDGHITILDTTKQTTQDSIDHQLVFTRVGDISPAFDGGERGFAKFLTDNIKYPKLAKRNNVMGRVFIQFIIETDGHLSHLQVIRDPGSGLGDETTRVLSLSPNWLPGVVRNQRVRTLYTVPVNFSLKE